MFLRRLNRIFSLKAFFKDRSGLSAIEFAICAPVLICAYLGLAELTLGMMASRRTAHLASTVGDLAAQSTTLTSANINDLFAIGASLMQPFPTGTNLKIRLTCVTMNTSNQAIVQWSQNSNWTSYTNGTVISQITTAQINPGDSLIMTETMYNWTSPIGDFLPGNTSYSDTFYDHPRNGSAPTWSP